MYAFAYSTDFIDALKLKVMLLVQLCINVCFFSLSYVIFSAIANHYFSDYQNYSKLIKLVDENLLECFFFAILTFQFRIRPLPNNFNVIVVNDSLNRLVK